jgi:hypothetical protein
VWHLRGAEPHPQELHALSDEAEAITASIWKAPASIRTAMFTQPAHHGR